MVIVVPSKNEGSRRSETSDGSNFGTEREQVRRDRAWESKPNHEGVDVNVSRFFGLVLQLVGIGFVTDSSAERLFGRRPLCLGSASGGVPVDFGLDRRTRLPEEVLVVLYGKVVAGAQ